MMILGFCLQRPTMILRLRARLLRPPLNVFFVEVLTGPLCQPFMICSLGNPNAAWAQSHHLRATTFLPQSVVQGLPDADSETEFTDGETPIRRIDFDCIVLLNEHWSHPPTGRT